MESWSERVLERIEGWVGGYSREQVPPFNFKLKSSAFSGKKRTELWKFSRKITSFSPLGTEKAKRPTWPWVVDYKWNYFLESWGRGVGRVETLTQSRKDGLANERQLKDYPTKFTYFSKPRALQLKAFASLFSYCSLRNPPPTQPVPPISERLFSPTPLNEFFLPHTFSTRTKPVY